MDSSRRKRKVCQRKSLTQCIINGIVKNKVNLPNIELFYFGEKPILNLKHAKIKVFHSKPKGRFDYIIDNSFLLQSHQKEDEQQIKNFVADLKKEGKNNLI